MSKEVPEELVQAALSAARQRGTDVATAPLTAIAAAAGVSRSTLLRRLGGSRAALDRAVRAAGVDLGGRPPVRERAIAAAAHLVGEHGLGAITLDAVAQTAECSLPSLHTVFGGRDGLLTEVFERYGPLFDLERLAARPPTGLERTVREIYQALDAAFDRQPRVLPALFADLFGRPDGPGNRMFQASFPRLFDSFGALLLPHVGAGRLRCLPLPLLIQQMLGPVVVHLTLRPALEARLGPDLPSRERSRDVFVDAFLRAVTVTGDPGHPEHPATDPATDTATDTAGE